MATVMYSKDWVQLSLISYLCDKNKLMSVSMFVFHIKIQQKPCVIYLENKQAIYCTNGPWTLHCENQNTPLSTISLLWLHNMTA